MAAIHVRALRRALPGLRSFASAINALAFFANCDPRILIPSGL